MHARVGVARVTEMPKSRSTLKSERRVMSREGCRVGTRALKLMVRRVIFWQLCLLPPRESLEEWVMMG